MNWILRKTIGLANVTLYITQHDIDGVTHIDIKQIATAGIEVSPENRVLNWTERSQDDKIFGKVVGRSRWTKLEELDVTDAEDKKWLTEGWDEDGEKVEARVDNENAGWNLIGMWGFTHINETRYYTRKMVIRNKKGKVIRDVLVYDYVGADDS